MCSLLPPVDRQSLLLSDAGQPRRVTSLIRHGYLDRRHLLNTYICHFATYGCIQLIFNQFHAWSNSGTSLQGGSLHRAANRAVDTALSGVPVQPPKLQ